MTKKTIAHSVFRILFIFLLLMFVPISAMNMTEIELDTQLRTLAGKPATGYPPNVHRCVHSATKLKKSGLAGTNCYNCDPSSNECNPGCQIIIDGLYHVCDNICLPDGYYFDPDSKLEGCFPAIKAQFKIAVERCGCDAGFRLSNTSTISTILIILLSCFFLWSY